ncbi:hypothetical protein [Mycobacterium sp. GA-2829]|uniref:hypothetical protein n=1 Tax=Mycobacterium sp. GA-2829 TaxID=1772283 RepID=UPI000740460A|nr:hypothetical protein [Mycobacterium sp. GA-2829]KUI33852.1 hypothetical protein AU194_15130 [Mycobacterium sp. GA-2829]
MYLSAEQLAAANTAIRRTFEQSSIAWQAIPHWDIGDPSATNVRDGRVNKPGVLSLGLAREEFKLTLAQISAPTPDSVLAEVIAETVKLARKVDRTVLDTLKNSTAVKFELTGTSADKVQSALIDARAALENRGFRAPSCLITNTEGLKALSTVATGDSALEAVLDSAYVNSLHRSSRLDVKVNKTAKIAMIMLGRRQRIAHGAAGEASCGEEPVDLAVSVMPSLEVIGEVGAATVKAFVRTRFALRIKDKDGVKRIVDEQP